MPRFEFALIVVIGILPGDAAAFMPLMSENARASLKTEPGCRRFDVLRGDDPSRIVLYEVYDDRAAFDAHLASDHYADFDARTKDMIRSKQVETYLVEPLTDAARG